MPAIEITIQGADKLIRAFARAPETVGAEVRTTMDNSLLLIESEARRLVPQDTRQLHGSIIHTVTGSGLHLTGRVGPSKQYGVFVEYGSRPHWPPRQALIGWARRKGIEPFLVQRAIARRGTRAQPFMRPALEHNIGRIEQLFAALGARIVSRFGELT